MLFLLIAWCCSSIAFAQKTKPTFHSFNSLQWTTGSSTQAFVGHSVNGLQWKRWFAGLGAGYDGYYHSTIPFFVEGRYSRSLTGNGLEAFVQTGVHIPLSNPNLEFENANGNSYQVGWLLGAGLDYRFRLFHQRFWIGSGYAFKQYRKDVENNVWNPVTQRIENIPIRNTFDLNRWVFRLGVIF